MKQVEIGALVEVSYTLRADGPQGEELESCPDENPFVFRVGEEEVLENAEMKALEFVSGLRFWMTQMP